MLPGTNILSLYHNIIKEKSEIRDTYKICIDACLNDYVINKLIQDKYIIKDDNLEIKDEKKLELRKKDKDEKNFNKELKRK